MSLSPKQWSIPLKKVSCSPVIFLLNGGGELLVVVLDVTEAHGQCVPLRPDQLLRVGKI